MVKVAGNVVYGSWNDGSDIYKDSKGYFVMQWNVEKETDYKKYLPTWKPAANAPRMRFDTKKQKWKLERKAKKSTTAARKRKTLKKAALK
jgi:hypothetical protein